MSVLVYTLSESDTGSIRYVGVTQRPLDKRLAEHLADARRNTRHTRKISWLKALIARGAEPVIEQVGSADDDTWQQVEQDWIVHLRDELGLSLVNTTDGGIGVLNPSPEERARRADWARAKFAGQPSMWAGKNRDLSAESRERMRQAALARAPITDEARENVRAAAKARWARARAEGAKQLCECNRCVVRRNNPAEIAKRSEPKLPKKSNHTRYHTNRGIQKEDCFYCVQDKPDVVEF